MVARQLGKVCLVGCEAMRIDLSQRTVTLADQALAEGELLTLDGNTGAVYSGLAQTVSAPPADLMLRLTALRAP